LRGKCAWLSSNKLLEQLYSSPPQAQVKARANVLERVLERD
jgi:hypothetical protein